MIKITRSGNKYCAQICTYNKNSEQIVSTVLVENIDLLGLAEFLERSMIPIFYIASAVTALKRRKYTTACFNSKRELFFLA